MKLITEKLRPENLKPKCVHVVALNNWYPELTYYTLPLLKYWAKQIGADFNLIDKPKFPGFPANYERLQVYEAGKDYFWNISIDADYLIHPEMEDPTEKGNPYVVMSEARMDISSFFKPNIYFFRDGRNQALEDSFVVTSVFTHDLWKPLNCTYEEAAVECIKNPRQVSEFNLSLNMCRFGLKFDGAIVDKSKHHHIVATSTPIDDPTYNPVKEAEKIVDKWKVENIILDFHNKK